MSTERMKEKLSEYHIALVIKQRGGMLKVMFKCRVYGRSSTRWRWMMGFEEDDDKRWIVEYKFEE